jgi:shikimate kinase
MNIVIIGYRGCGKSAVSRALSVMTGMKHISLDDEISRLAELTIPEIVQNLGWDGFRDLESDMTRRLALTDRCIIDTGGGVILRAENTAVLKKNGRIFWLTAEIPTIASRIGGDTLRPSLTGSKGFIDEIEEVLTTRLPLYRAAADHVIITDNRTPGDIATEILTHVDAS